MKKIILTLVLFVLLTSQSLAQTTGASATTFSPAYTTPKDLFQHMQNEVDSRLKDVTATYTSKSLTNGLSQTMTTLQWNPNVWTNKGTPIDFTGLVMWSDFTPPASGGYNSNFWRGGALISPQHIIFASHIMFEVGKKIRFFTKSGEMVERTLTNRIAIPPFGLLGSDITVGVLDAPVPNTITHYPILSAAQWKQAFKDEIPDPYEDRRFTLPIIFLDQEKKVSVSMTYKRILYDDSANFTHSAATNTGKRKDFYETLVGGDSGNPTFVLVGGKPVLISSHTSPAGGPNYAYYYDQINDAMAKLGGGYKLSSIDLSGFTSGATKPRPTGAFASNFTLTPDKTIYRVGDLIKIKASFAVSPEWVTWLKDRNQTQGEVTFILKDNVNKTLISKKYAFNIAQANTVIDFEWKTETSSPELNGKKFAVDAFVTADTIYENTSLKDLSFERNIISVKKSGAGSGVVTGASVGINCGTDCNRLALFGNKVALTAVADSGSRFTGWTGACTGMVCEATINAEKVEVTANFEKTTTPVTPAPTAQNRRPVAVDGNYKATTDSVNINLSATDADYDPLTFTPSKLVLTYGELTKQIEGKYVYTVKKRPAVDATETFTFTVSDGKTTSKDDGVITIAVPKSAANVSPSADDDNDGVPNASDLCKGTPKTLESKINSAGCVPPKITVFDLRPVLNNNLRNVSNFELGKTGLGKIKFKDPVDLSRDNGLIDIDSNVTISDKTVHIESSSIPELNKPATITLYNVTETNPRILRDGKVCEPPQCVIESFSNGTLVFTVSGFSTYTVDETPTTSEPAPKPKKKETPSAKSDAPAKNDDAELIKVLTAQLNALIAELNRLTGGGSNASFTADLSIGVSHPDVLKLQKLLNSKGFVITTSGPGSLGNETTFYGARTAAAVKKFQMSKGITPTGNVGPLTRAALNAI